VDESLTNVERVKLNRRCYNGGQWRYTIAPRNATLQRWLATRCNSRCCCGAGRQRVVARGVVAALANNALQLATLLWRWPATCYNSRRCYNLAALLRWPAMRWTSQRCCDGQQRAAPLANAALQCFFIFSFLLDNFKRKKEREREGEL